ncbi:MAG: NusG domain II-containing protein [Treponema sp.]|nr:NusG domain II-containing protein [Treponema sp.]
MAAIFISLSIILSEKKEGIPYLIVTSQEGEAIYRLDKDAVYKVKGPLGYSTIVVKNGEAYFEDSPCPNKTCVQSAHCKKNLDWSGCLPNQIFIRVEKQEEKTQADALAF